MSLKILLEKNKERENGKSEGETREEKKAMAALLVFMLTSLEIFFLKEKDCLR